MVQARALTTVLLATIVSSACAQRFTGELGPKNGVARRKYIFQGAKLATKNGAYSDLMVTGCAVLGMKPVCDHPSYCDGDPNAVYLGQSGHLAYKPHRNNNNYIATGFSKIRDKWNGKCSYTGAANANSALCNIPANSHSWRTPAQANPGFICAKGATFSAALQGKNGVMSQTWEFEIMKLKSKSGKYSDRMKETCTGIGMMPVCDHPSYCKNDKAAVYLGQSGHLAYKPHRNNNGLVPSGMASIRNKWNGLCSYTGNARGNYALCNIPANTHAWRTPAQADPGFVCAKVLEFHALLGAKNGMSGDFYSFSTGRLMSRGGKYSDRMIETCTKFGMKPVCDHPSYCKSDEAAVYLGQSGHLAYRPHRYNNNYSPPGLAAIRGYWNNKCSYTGSANGNYALCNIPINTHAWRHPGQVDPGFICGKKYGMSFSAFIEGKNGAPGQSWIFRSTVLTNRGGAYSDRMVERCAQFGMKPVCDHPSYCKTDKKAAYIGQSGHLAYKPHRNNNNYSPTGFAAIRDKWTGLCSYTANANGNYALCNIPKNTHAWRHPGQANPGFVCAQGNEFSATLGAGRYGVLAKKYQFRIVAVLARSGKYSDRMVASCKTVGMKPVCDHPSYCRTDGKAVYLGQANHIAYPPHRRINSWFPAGWKSISSKWNGLCSYTNNANGNYALCNIPTNTHAWRTPAQYNPGFICAVQETFSAKLGAKNGAPSSRYNFIQAGLMAKSGKYSDRMIQACAKYSMMPVCDHPSYCKTDKKSVYLGQSGHLGYAPHRNNDGYSPPGFKAIRNKWNGLCSYTGNARGNYALCNIPTNTHAWKTPAQADPGFICAKEDVRIFSAKIGSKNGVPARSYIFRYAELATKSGSYSSNMIKVCGGLGMQPVCDHPAYCKNDEKSIYIGQSGHLAYRPHRNNNNYSPTGFSKIRDQWNNLCSYTNNANGNYALCNIPINTHAWRHPGQYNPGFICAKGDTFTATLKGKNGVGGKTWIFEIASLASRSGSYSANMIKTCTGLVSKPVCDHPSYCKNDAASVYLGQTYHLAYKPHRNNNSLMPGGFAGVRDKWNGLCSYTAKARGNYALCNVPINTHAWRTPGQYNPGFVCAKPEQFTASITGKNGVKSATYIFEKATASPANGKYSDRMIAACKAIGMKPVCDHPSYCKNDKAAVYLGQSGHLAYRPHRNNNNYSPGGLAEIREQWNGLCSYTANANGNYALCNIPTNTHAWRHPGQYNPGFVCGKEDLTVFTGTLGSKNGVAMQQYLFHGVKLSAKSGSYSKLMIAKCSNYGMKPVCDHPSYCKNDKLSLYIGQSGHLAYRPHRNNNNYSPTGLSRIRDQWNGLCSYTANANGNYALCNIPTNTHAWRHPGQANPGFICGRAATFSAKIGSKNGNVPREYVFQIGFLTARSGKYSDRMIQSCKLFDMMPVCDHPSYCKNDAKSLYLGQSGHLAYRPHRNNNNYSPPGFAAIRNQWTGLCSYTANANRNYALCNIPTNTHAWRHPGQYNPGFVCGAGITFKATLTSKNNVPGGSWTFSILAAVSRSGKYSDRMKQACSSLKAGMKPVCDHPSYCKNDKTAFYIGQSGHLAYPPHRNNNNYMPAGFAAIASKWTGLCSYTANANRNYALCNIPTNTHAWRTPAQYNPGFVCAKPDAMQFIAKLGAKNGVLARSYLFRVMKLTSKSGSYSAGMTKICAGVAMQPVCDHPSYCKNDKAALYIGQSGHLAYKPHRNNNNYVPGGFAAVRDNWNGLCSYTANANRNYALCNIPANTHAWRTPAQYNPGFVCGKGNTFGGRFGGKNGVASRTYTFEITTLTKRSGQYSALMTASCSLLAMKPVCDHPSYCRNDAKSLYLGQSGHLAYKPHRNNNNYSPPGLAPIRDMWNGLCSYTANANGNYALCNIPINSHSWRHPGQTNPGFVCGKGEQFMATLSAKNGVKQADYIFEITTLAARSGAYSTRMREECTKLGMMPVCDHPAYCKTDKKALYIGQSGHLAYRPHRNNNNYSPGGFAAIRDKWSGLCSYTNNANRNYALCNIPTNTHAWRHPGQYNPGFVCGKEDVLLFTQAIGYKNGNLPRVYNFRVSKLTSKSGSYSSLMIAKCAETGMKPVCDHPSYCKNDAKSLYLGQSGHLAYAPHRNNNNYSPPGLAAIRDNWKSLCSYTAAARGNTVLCNIPTNTHAWRSPAQYNPGFVCATNAEFTAKIGAKNGAKGKLYTFDIALLTSRSGKYSDRMRERCKVFGMMPVCDHPSYCKNDGKSIYLGQSGHLAYAPHRNNNNYSPPGFAAIRSKWTGLCSYTNNANGNYALCNIPTNTHAWRHPGQYNPGFMCAGTKPIKATLGAKNGVEGGKYLFQMAFLPARNGKYSDRMIQACGSVGMKPVCDHPSYCKTDVNSIYLGQSGHLAYPPHRNQANYQPAGLKYITQYWDGVCSYTANANGNYALCNIPENTHAWRHPGQYDGGFMCGKRDEPTFTARLSAKNGKDGRTYLFRIAKLPIPPTKTKYLRITTASNINPGSTQHSSGHSWDLYEVKCTMDGKVQKFTADSASHMSYNGRYPAKNLYDGNKRTFWAGNPAACGGQALIDGCQWIVLKFANTIPGSKQLKCTLTQDTKTKAWAVSKVTIAQSFDKENWSKEKAWKLNYLPGGGGADTVITTEKLNGAKGSYSSLMVAECANFAMKPVCDHPSYCKNDGSAIYLGQSGHLAYRPHRYNNGYIPGGFAAVRSKWTGLCSYTGKARGNYALCNIPANSHSWQTPARNPGFVCAKGASFTAVFGGKNGVMQAGYDFEAASLINKGGKYSDRMKEACKKLGMKPVCDHPSYCKNDKAAVYLGQSGHLAYRPHRNNNNYSPPGLAYVRDKWNGLCSYTGNARGNYALCNIPTNTHAWRTAGQYNPGFICAVKHEMRASLLAKNGVAQKDYLFAIAIASPANGKYSDRMITACKKLGMKPVCDHPSYCKTDKKGIYLGQDGHLAYAPHRNTASYLPPGLHDLAKYWNGLCSYTANANGNYALCNIPTNTHAWRHPGQYNPGFMCGKEDIVSFSAAIGSKNGNVPSKYDFVIAKPKEASGKYSTLMIETCKNWGMMPVCDHPSYCKTHKTSVYLGQSGHLAYKPHRNNNNYSPPGLASIRNYWTGLCSYTGNARGNYALCNIPTNTHSWQTPASKNPGFICSKRASWTQILGSKNGAKGTKYEFEFGYLLGRSGKYSDRMIQSCKLFDMKPVCDHPSYCKNDKAAVYLGQSGHLAYRPHRYNNNYSPPGLSEIRDKWTGLCSYTANANRNYALCNIPTNTHAWRHPGQTNPGFVCAKTATFKASLGAKNGRPAAKYEFMIAMAAPANGKYSDRMISGCKSLGMKPICDHPAYCRNDAQSIYIGQSGHLAYAPHRNYAAYQPSGFKAIADNWSGLCSYTANANRNYALCNIPTNTHAWRHPGQYNPGFICGKEDVKVFTARLGAKNGVTSRLWEFRVAVLAKKSGKYSTEMIKTCKQYTMMPVCDHPSYCKTDKASVYLGQSGHLAYKPHRNNNGYSPAGFSAIRNNWNGLCSYTGNARGNYALCNIPANTHAWRTPAQYNPGFVCAKTGDFSAVLAGKNGVPGRMYNFEIAVLSRRNGKYSDRMVEECKKLDMKPVCDHPSYCKADAKSLWIGQSGHLAYMPHRKNNGYIPGGFAAIASKWDSLCSYTANARGNYALCNIPINTHAWRHPGQANPGFVCGTVTTVKVDLGGKNGVKSNSWTLSVTGLTSKSGSYSDRMIEECSKLDMKPVCDHPAYCKQDVKSAYLGQSGHLAYAPHRNNDGYLPSGLSAVRKMWSGLCSYTGNARGNYALCNIPTNTHSWQTPARNPGFVCASLGHLSMTVFLGPKNGVTAKQWMFSAMKLTSKSGSYANLMKAKCSEVGMKPVCDHRSYCGKDTGAVFIGQTHHIAYPPHRRINSWFPSGWSAISSSWNGLCSYTARARGNYALCNIPANTHAWKTPAQANPGFMCGKAATFSATLAAKNGAKGGLFDFAITKLAARNGKYSDRMIEQCKKLGMKPVCDHPSYCKNDKTKSLYLGQSGHLAYAPHRNNNNYMPAGLSEIRSKWSGLCSYTANANRNYALCNIPVNTHAWRHPGQYNPGFVCGKPGSFTATLKAKNGVKAATYEFTIGSLLARGGKYSDRMVDSCKQYGMKPVCDHPSYCKNDKSRSLYLGQSGHLAYAPHRNNNNYAPGGFAAIASKWSTLCSYTNNANRNYALCNIPANTHAWRHPGQYNPGFVCGKVAGVCTPYQVANSNFAKKGSITGSKGSTITVKCSSGFTGGGKVTCGSNGKFTTTACKKVTACGSTKIANSNKKGGTGKGTSGKSVTISCDKGFTGGGKLLCSNTKWSWDTGGVCKKAATKKCPGDADGNKVVNIEDLLILLGSYGKTGTQKADFDANKKVNIEDLLILLGKYGKKC